MEVTLIEHYGTDLTPVNAARVSFNKESDWEYDSVYDETLGYWRQNSEAQLSDKDTKLIHYLAKNKHTSCFEHQGASLRLKVPVFVARQIQRHRTFSYNEVSRRYVDDRPEFFIPTEWRKAADNVKQGSSEETIPCPDFDIGGLEFTFEEVCGMMREYYEGMLERGIAPEQARMILPQNMYTEFYMTGNLRAWSHFLKLRLDNHAQKEVQVVAKMVQDILVPLWPVSMEALLKYD